MKLIKIIFLLSFLLHSFFLKAQKPDTDNYYKDTIFEFYGAKVEVQRAIANDKMFKCRIVITNNSEHFMIIDPAKVLSSHSQSDKTFPATSKKKIVIAPKYSKAFGIKFVDKDFRQPEIKMDFTAIELTDSIVGVYEISDLKLYSETTKTNGPVTWTLIRIPSDDRKPQENFRVDGTISYTGNKFLGIFHNNITLQTNDGKTYVNESRAGHGFSYVRNKFYYDKSKPYEKQLLIFPVECSKIKPELSPSVSFNNVFREYSLVTIEGFKITLREGTILDFKGNDKNDDIEEVD